MQCSAVERNDNADSTVGRYWAHKNAWSMDGLPGMQRGLHTAGTDKVKPIKKLVGPHAGASLARSRRPQRIFVLRHLVLAALLSSLSTAVFVLAVLQAWFGGLDSALMGRKWMH